MRLLKNFIHIATIVKNILKYFVFVLKSINTHISESNKSAEWATNSTGRSRLF